MPYPPLQSIDPGDVCATEEVTLADRMSVEVLTSSAPPRPTLVLLSGLDAGRTLRLVQGVNVVGRIEDVEVTLADDSVSRRHCEILVEPDGSAYIRDLGSTNGTFVDDRRTGDRAVALRDGDLVRLSGSVLLKFAWQDEVEEAVQRNLYNAAVRDGLTGLYNKRYLMERFEQEFAWATRNGRPLSVVVFDLDHFKQVNDVHGHDAGDEVLRQVARCVLSTIRREDVLARFGGEEFVLLMRETDVFRAIDVAERVRHSIGRTPVYFMGKKISVTTSIGVAHSRERGVEACADVFSRADQRLYQAKRGGRDQVVASDTAE